MHGGLLQISKQFLNQKVSRDRWQLYDSAPAVQAARLPQHHCRKDLPQVQADHIQAAKLMIAGENSPRNITSCKSKRATNVSGRTTSVYLRFLDNGSKSWQGSQCVRTRKGRRHLLDGKVPRRQGCLPWSSTVLVHIVRREYQSHQRNRFVSEEVPCAIL